MGELLLWGGGGLVFLEEQNTGYFPMYLSQFHNFRRRLTFFRGALNHKEMLQYIFVYEHRWISYPSCYENSLLNILVVKNPTYWMM
jgi:hypothetical protein